MKNARRYYLHYRLKNDAGLKVAARKKQVEIGQNEQINPIYSKYLNELKNVGYNIQLTI